MRRDFSFRAGPRVVVQFVAGCAYRRVTEAAAQAILAAGAGEVVEDHATEAGA